MAHEKRSGYQYQLCVEGHIGKEWVDWPCEVEITQTFDQHGQRAISLVSAYLQDQPGLYSLLEKLRDLNLKLVYTQREEPKSD